MTTSGGLRVLTWWTRLERRELFLLNKLLTGEFRVGVSHTLVVRAVAQLASLPTAVVEHRLMGHWEPSAEAFAALVAPEGPGDDPSRPYPFCLASPFEGDISALGGRDEWLAEWKWDGIRAQLIQRAGAGVPVVARRGADHRALPGDRGGGARRCPTARCSTAKSSRSSDDAPRPFADLQQRIGRQRQGARGGGGRAGRVPGLRRARGRRRGHPRRCRCAIAAPASWSIWSPSAGPLRVSEDARRRHLGRACERAATNRARGTSKD